MGQPDRPRRSRSTDVLEKVTAMDSTSPDYGAGTRPCGAGPGPGHDPGAPDHHCIGVAARPQPSASG